MTTEKKTNQNPESKPEVINQSQQKAEAEAKAKAEAEAKAKAEAEVKKQKQPVDLGEYERYSELKSVEISGSALKEETKKELNDLEKKLKSCEGKKPKEKILIQGMLRAAIDNEQVLLFKDIPVPANIEKIIKDARATGYYLS